MTKQSCEPIGRVARSAGPSNPWRRAGRPVAVVAVVGVAVVLASVGACSRSPRGVPASHDAQLLAAAIRGESRPEPAQATQAPNPGRTPRNPSRSAGNASDGDDSDRPARVIVELRMPEPSPGTTPRPFDSRIRKASIADARSMLLGSLSPGSAHLVRSYDTIPFVVLEVTPVARKALEASPLVKSVQVDRLMRTQDVTPAPTPTATTP